MPKALYYRDPDQAAHRYATVAMYEAYVIQGFSRGAAERYAAQQMRCSPRTVRRWVAIAYGFDGNQNHLKLRYLNWADRRFYEGDA